MQAFVVIVFCGVCSPFFAFKPVKVADWELHVLCNLVAFWVVHQFEMTSKSISFSGTGVSGCQTACTIGSGICRQL